ncbi:hypothetical protein VTK73DRAFT_192 [Phialemonium thermophilum]|uniref:Ryanodine receptor Ryr domain-containing protein n=1 Tax=Phialemonium thermophilum TaxID=223376 RepID=A0ABR3XFN9_9PEZI
MLSDMNLSEISLKIHKPPSLLTLDAASSGIRSVVELEFHQIHGRDAFRVKTKQALNTQPRWHAVKALSPQTTHDDICLWVLQDADEQSSFTDRDSDAAICAIRQNRPRFLLYHMSAPLCKGKLWNTLRRGPFVGAGDQQDPEQLILIVSADDLRAEGVELSYGLSWERTCQDFVEQLGSVGRLVTLVTCAHLIVRFGCDGAIYHRGLQAAKPVLLFDAAGIEGEFERRNVGAVPGVAEAFVAGFAQGLACSADFIIEDAVKSGLWAARRLASRGLASCEPLAFAMPDITQDLGMRENERGLLRFRIPSDEIGSGSDGNWSLIDYLIGDPAEIGRRIVTSGVEAIAGQVPLASFRNLVVFDRQEIESFGTLSNFLREYLSRPQTRPLNIALCGPVGSGKAFASFEVASSVSSNWGRLRFDLSQFAGVEDLQAAFHSARDCTLRGKIPLVYFNGFDSPLSGAPLGWLPHVLPAMLGGSFSDNGTSRPIGPAVFLFGSTIFESSSKLQRRAASATAATTRLSDFVNCLHGSIDVLGLNRIDFGDGVDRLYPVRRAVVLRRLLGEREPGLLSGTGGRLDIDDGILNSLLLTPHYRQGIRSLRSILAMSRLTGCRHFDRAALPPASQLALHVLYEDFEACRRGLSVSDSVREAMAERLHEVYLQATSHRLEKPVLWRSLDQELKMSSRAHVDAIPQKLRLISCFLSEKQEYREPVLKLEPEQIELLAEAEHDRWNSERLQKQWRLGEREREKRKNPFLVPWGDLDENYRDIDRAMVASYPTIVQPYKIYRMGGLDETRYHPS